MLLLLPWKPSLCLSSELCLCPGAPWLRNHCHPQITRSHRGSSKSRSRGHTESLLPADESWVLVFLAHISDLYRRSFKFRHAGYFPAPFLEQQTKDFWGDHCQGSCLKRTYRFPKSLYIHRRTNEFSCLLGETPREDAKFHCRSYPIKPEGLLDRSAMPQCKFKAVFAYFVSII